MSIERKTYKANRSNYGAKRDTSKIKYIVIHYTGNDGDHDESNSKYFKNNIVKASAHYFVDSDSITQSVPDNYIAYSVGGSKYASSLSTGGAKHYNQCTNANSISIELCDDIKNGKVYPSTKTINNALTLTKELMKKYDIPASKVIRHFDVTGKLCPKYWCASETKNKLWKSAFHDKLKAAEPKTFKVKIIVNDLNIRKGPGVSYARVGEVEKGVIYTIVKTKGSWGQLKSGAGWICIDEEFVKKV